MDVLGLAFAFVAGMFALFSPCGFPMLPGYVSYYIGAKVSLERAFIGGVVCTLGLLTIFSIIGVIASILGGGVSEYAPFLELVAGLITIIMGLSMTLDVRLPAFSPSIVAPRRRTLLGIFLYGVAYGLATLGCSAPIFFSVLFYAVVLGGSLYGVAIFMVYAVGIGLPLIITTIFVSTAKTLILKKMVRAAPLLHRVGGLVLVLVGLYLMYYYFAFL